LSGLLTLSPAAIGWPLPAHPVKFLILETNESAGAVSSSASLSGLFTMDAAIGRTRDHPSDQVGDFAANKSGGPVYACYNMRTTSVAAPGKQPGAWRKSLWAFVEQRKG
jgi:hypothetical protein